MDDSRDPDDGELLSLAEAIARRIRKERESAERQEQALRDIQDRSASTEARLAELERGAKLARKLIVAIAVAALGTLGTVAKGLYDRGGLETAIELRLRALERGDARRVEREDRELEERARYRRERDRDPHTFPPLPTTKGPQP